METTLQKQEASKYSTGCGKEFSDEMINLQLEQNRLVHDQENPVADILKNLPTDLADNFLECLRHNINSDKIPIATDIKPYKNTMEEIKNNNSPKDPTLSSVIPEEMINLELEQQRLIHTTTNPVSDLMKNLPGELADNFLECLRDSIHGENVPLVCKNEASRGAKEEKKQTCRDEETRLPTVISEEMINLQLEQNRLVQEPTNPVADLLANLPNDLADNFLEYLRLNIHNESVPIANMN